MKLVIQTPKHQIIIKQTTPARIHFAASHSTPEPTYTVVGKQHAQAYFNSEEDARDFIDILEEIAAWEPHQINQACGLMRLEHLFEKK